MKITKISQNKIKILIPYDELYENNINYDEMLDFNDKTNSFFMNILEQAQSETKIDFENSQIVIEVYPYLDEGFAAIMTVNPMRLNRQKYRYLNYKVKSKQDTVQKLCYQFDSFETVLDCVRRINPDTIQESVLYQVNSVYILQVAVSGLQSEPDMLKEYGRKLPSFQYLNGYAGEYGKVLIEHDAVQTLQEVF
mgnify:FL=1